jgi:acetyltransferase-like isoleucine patch superfamily enzyme
MLPVRVSNRCALVNLKGSLEIGAPISPGMIHIGYGHVGIFDRKRERSVLNIRGKIIFKGNCYLGHGIKINIAETGTLIFGDKVNITAESAIDCQKEISFGEGCLVSWENLFIDSDHHKIFDSDGKLKNPPQAISIGNNVWVGCRCLILKGTAIPDNCVIAAGTLLTGVYTIPNAIIAGSPAKVVKENIYWKN